MGIVDFPRSRPCIANGGEGIIAKYYGVVLFEESSMKQYSPLKIELTKSFVAALEEGSISETDTFSLEPHRFRLDSVLTEK